MRGYPQLSLWISIALAMVCFFPRSHKRHKKTSIIEASSLSAVKPNALPMKCYQKTQTKSKNSIPEKSIRGNMASSGIFVSAVQTFSSNSFNTAKEQRNML